MVVVAVVVVVDVVDDVLLLVFFRCMVVVLHPPRAHTAHTQAPYPLPLPLFTLLCYFISTSFFPPFVCGERAKEAFSRRCHETYMLSFDLTNFFLVLLQILILVLVLGVW